MATFGRMASGSANRAKVDPIREPQPLGILPRHGDRSRRRIGPLTATSASSSATASATAPDPVPTSNTVPAPLERDLDQQLGLGARDQDPGVHRQIDPPEPAAADDVGHRLPPTRRRTNSPKRRAAAGSIPRLGIRHERRPVRARRLGEQHLGVEPRRIDARGARASAAALSASRTDPAAGPQLGSPPRAACASSRARFSSAARASVNSWRSPARTSSRLWTVSFTRWSVTRPWGKL